MRPSKNTDQLLIKAAKELLLKHGTLNISMRDIAKHAGVNMGMFYYNFKDRDDFISHVLQEFYEDFFSSLTIDAASSPSAFENLRAAFVYIGEFAIKHRLLVSAIFIAAVTGDATVRKFLEKNITRHLNILIALIQEAQKKKEMINVSPFVVVTMVMGGLNAPSFVYGAFSQYSLTAKPLAQLGATTKTVISSEALSERVDILLCGLKRKEKK